MHIFVSIYSIYSAIFVVEPVHIPIYPIIWYLLHHHCIILNAYLPFLNSMFVQASFSSMGPTLDGRIKPDVVSIGNEVDLGD